jgi:hypothetical protein
VRVPPPLSAIVFAVLGAVLLVSALLLAILGSFGFIAVASVGMFFIAAALIAQAAPSPESRAPALLALAAIALIVFGLTASSFFYLGWGLLAGAVILALLNGRRTRTQR